MYRSKRWRTEWFSCANWRRGDPTTRSGYRWGVWPGCPIFGWKDVESRTPLAGDNIFRMFSQTKAITTVALLTLYEQGKFQLDDPVLTQIRDEIKGLDINSLTPIEALNKLNEIKKISGL